ncbi:MAG: hypothetical protein KDA84_30795, partial [Planctomycetaceae bacterium]|nr:hypothetical protein [Planctomycetaceae bacterium]
PRRYTGIGEQETVLEENPQAGLLVTSRWGSLSDDFVSLRSTDKSKPVMEVPAGSRPELFYPEIVTYAGSNAALSSDGETLAVFSGKQSVAVWDVKKKQKRFTRKTNGSLTAIGTSDTGKYVAVALEHSQEPPRLNESSVLLYDTQTGNQIGRYQSKQYLTVSVDITPDGKTLVAASPSQITVWHTGSGRELGRISFPLATIRHVRISKDGRLLWATPTRGSSILYDLKTKTPVAEFFPLDDGTDWLVVTPEGLFDGSLKGRNEMAYRLGDGLTVEPVDRFFDDFYVPGLLQRIQAGQRPTPQQQIAVPPKVRIVSSFPSSYVESSSQKIVVEAEDEGGGADRITLFINGRHLETDDELVRLDNKTIRRSFHILLSHGENEIVAKAKGRTGSGTGQSEAITLIYQQPPKKVTLHVAAIGVGDY